MISPRYYEFMYHLFFSNTEPGQYSAAWEQSKAYAAQPIPNDDVMRFNTIVYNNQQIIKGRTVVDIGCHLGYLTLACLDAGAQHVVAADARQEKLPLVDFVCNEVAGYSNLEVVALDAHNYGALREVCLAADTVLMSGLLYHVADHYPILEAITNSRASALILDNTANQPYSPEPNILWSVETTADSVNGWERGNRASIVVGEPNEAFLKLVLENHGWVCASSETYVMRANRTEPTTRQTLVFVR